MLKLLLNLVFRGGFIFSLVYVFSSIVPSVSLKNANKFILALLVSMIYIMVEYILCTLKIRHVYYLQHRPHHWHHRYYHRDIKNIAQVKDTVKILNPIPMPPSLPDGDDGAEKITTSARVIPEAATKEAFENFSFL